MVLRNTGQVSYRLSPNLALPIILLITRLELWALEKQILQSWSLFLSHYLRGIWYPHDIHDDGNLIIWLRLYLLGFSTAKLLIFFPFPCVTFCKSPSLTCPQTWGRWITWIFMLSSFHIWPQVNVTHLSKWWSHSVKMHSCFQKLCICNKYMPDTMLDAKH